MEGTVQKDVRSQSSEEAEVGGESEGTSCCLIISLSPLVTTSPPPPTSLTWRRTLLSERLEQSYQ